MRVVDIIAKQQSLRKDKYQPANNAMIYKVQTAQCRRQKKRQKRMLNDQKKVNTPRIVQHKMQYRQKKKTEL
jgi:hypothetical protein